MFGAVSDCVRRRAQWHGNAEVSNGRRSTLARSGADFVAGAALSQFQVFPRLEMRGRRSTFARSGAALPQGQVQISWQVQNFRKVK